MLPLVSSYCLLVFDQGAQNTQNAADFATFTGLSRPEGGSAETVATWPKKNQGQDMFGCLV